MTCAYTPIAGRAEIGRSLGPLATQPSLLVESQARERACLRNKMDGVWAMTLWFSAGHHMYTRTCTHGGAHGHTHTQFMYMNVLSACVYVHRVRVLFPRESEEGIGCPGTRVSDGCEWPVSAETWTRVLRKHSECSTLLTHPVPLFFCKFWGSKKKICV